MRLSLVLEMDNADAVDEVALAVESFTSVIETARDARVAEPGLQLQLTIVVAQAGHPVVERELLPRARAAGVFDDIGVVVAPNTSYYEKKMVGALKSDGDLVAFIDSDVTYDEAWLRQMLVAFSDPTCDFVYGCTYARLGSPRENATAVVWQFPIDDPRDPRQADTNMRWSNNWVVRREFLLANPLPRVSGDLKLEGSYWDQLARDRGARVHHVLARAVHVQPAGLFELLDLAMRSGRSYVVGFRRDELPLRRLAFQLLRHNGLRTLLQRVRSLRKGPAPHLQFSLARVGAAHCTWQVGLALGAALEVLHPRRPVSFDYATLESGLTRA